MYAIYSKKQRKTAGMVVYKRKDGSKVYCTSVGKTKDCGCLSDDIVHLGEVTEFVDRVEWGDGSSRWRF